MVFLGPLIFLGYAVFKWFPQLFLFIADAADEWFAKEKRKYQYTRKHEYNIRIPFVMEKYFGMAKVLHLNSWGKQNDKLRDIVMQCAFFCKVAEKHNKKAILFIRDVIPPELAWFREELLKTGIELRENY